MEDLSKSEFLKIIVDSIKNNVITLNEIINLVVPKKEKLIPDEKKKLQKEYFKQWYKKNREQVLLKVKATQSLKKIKTRSQEDIDQENELST